MLDIIVKIMLLLFYLLINISVFILGIFLLKTSIRQPSKLVNPPDRYLLWFPGLEFFKKTTVRKIFVIWYFLFGSILIIVSITMIIFFTKSVRYWM